MKITLLSPCLSTTERYGKALGKVGPTTEPLGLAYLAASIQQETNHDVEIIDAAVMNYTPEQLKKRLILSKPNVVGVMMLTPMYFRAQEVVRLTRQVLPDSTIIVGGPHVTIFPSETMKENPEIDYAVVGEGEITIVELLSAIDRNKNVKDVKGIVYRLNRKVEMTSMRPFIQNIDEIPLPARELLPMEKYKPAPTYYRELPSHIILTSRGCPFHCTYCSKIFGKTYRFHSIKRIMEEVNLLISKYKAKEIIFRDDTFTINPNHVKELCNEMINAGLNKKIRWTCMTRVNLVTPEMLKLMKRAGCWSIHYGVESGSQRLLDLIEKGITLEQVKTAVKWTKEAGIEVKAFFMLGLPSETYEESLKTIEFTKFLDPDWIQVTLTTPYPGTKLFDIAKAEGTIKSLKWEDYQTWAGWSDKDLVYTTKGREPEELKALQKRAMREFYMRPKFILRQINELRYHGRLKTYVLGAYALVRSKILK